MPSSNFRKGPFDTGSVYLLLFICQTARHSNVHVVFPLTQNHNACPVLLINSLLSCSSRRLRIVKWKKNTKIPKERSQERRSTAPSHSWNLNQSEKSTNDKRQESQKRRTRIYLKVEAEKRAITKQPNNRPSVFPFRETENRGV